MNDKPRSRAFALVLVMITIVLAATMAVFFLSSAGRERRGVDLYSRGGQVRHLAGMTVNQVIGQISLATKEGTATTPVSWASQPGMVRTYGQDGNPKSVYKLYSWDNLYEPGGAFNGTSATELPPGDWKTTPALYTDLNQAMNGVYPIVNPGAIGKVDGFSIDTSNAAVSGSGLQAPMPVKWLYVLEDGQMVAPSGGSGNTATVPGAGPSNQIVGRVAFWTDDETSKVNVNTASEGAFWDWPKAATYNEMQFAGNPPIGGEFNRLPGHPAMTSLSAVFPELSPGDRWANVTSYRSKLKSLLDVTPRIPYSDQSSRGGTYPVQTANFDYGPTASLGTIPNVSLSLKTDRLFVSPDELYFTATNRTPSSIVTVDMLRERAFFLTANSRAPETTLFETPRISLWPVTWPYPTAHASLSNRQTTVVSSPSPDSTALNSNTWMRAEERLLAFDSILNSARSDGGDRYFFQRQNCESPSFDYTNIRRNRELLSYLQRETSLEVPGYGGSFVNKLGAVNRDMVLANVFNVARSFVNQYTLQDDGKLMYSYTPVSFSKFLQPNGVVRSNYAESGAFSPFPLKLDLGSGEITTISEFPMLREAALVFYATQRIAPTKKSDPTLDFNNPLNWNNLINVGGVAGYPAGSRTTKMRAVLLLDFSQLRGATRNNQPVFWVKLGGASMSANGSGLGFGSAVAKLDYRNNGAHRMPSYMLPFFQKDSNGLITGVKTFSNGDVNDSNYGLISNEVGLDSSGAALEFNFSGGPMTIEIYGLKNGDPSADPTSDSTLKVATYTVDFSSWNGSLKVPIAPRWNYFDKMNSEKDTPPSGQSADPKTSWCPNPGFSGSTHWAALEIAPAYRTADAASDPATGGANTVPAFSSLYATISAMDKSINYPSDTGPTSFIFRPPTTYAFQSSAGPVMTDYRNRILFYPNLASTVNFSAEYSGVGLNAVASTGNQFSPGGFPATTIYDTVISVTPKPTGSGNADPRLATKFQFDAIKNNVDPGTLRKKILTAEYLNVNQQYHTLGASNSSPAGTGYISTALYSVLASNLTPNGIATDGSQTTSGRLGYSGASVSDASVVGVNSLYPASAIPANSAVGDWSSGAGYNPDGGLLARPDQDFQALATPGGGGLFYSVPYFAMIDSATDGLNTPFSKGYFSPNRQIPSPITLLGGLPTSATVGWQSLLFSPNPAIGSTHPGLAGLPDYLFLDLFWMPVAEPYPISEEFATAGKINLNYKIMPFPYINRRTGLHALLKNTWLTALNISLASDYKSHDSVKGDANSQTRYTIDPAETVKFFDSNVFDAGNIFRSAAQVCSMYLVPQGSTSATVQNFWSDKLLTSDTAREQPYEHIYSRVTTKSNTFTVHWRVQVLRKQPNSAAGTWDESKDKMASELRGATLIERYLDPNATDIPDYATDFTAKPLSSFYKWRTISENYFQP